MLQSDRLFRMRMPAILAPLAHSAAAGRFSQGARSGTMHFGNTSVPTDRSGTYTSKTKAMKNIVTIHDFRHLIPAKMELALEYRVLGDSPEILAKHNAMVADKYGYKIISDCWRLLSVVLVKNFVMDDPMMVNGGIPLLSQYQIQNKLSSTLNEIGCSTHRFYWGSHPFGGKWLAKEIMKYFERVGDIQMLAMLSCVMYESDVNRSRLQVPINTPYTLPDVHTPGTLSNITLSPLLPNTTGTSDSTFQLSPGFSGHSHFVPYSRRESKSKSIPSASTSALLRSTRAFPVSATSSFDNESIYNAGYDTSANNRRGIGRTQGQLPGILLESETASPLIKLGSSSQSINNVFNNAFGQAVNASRHPSVSSNHAKLQNHNDNSTVVKIDFINKEQFDLFEDDYSLNMQSVMDAEKLNRWRSEYASLLYLWGLPVSRAKILKFNYSTSDENNSSRNNSHSYQNSENYKEHRGSIGWFASNVNSDEAYEAMNPWEVVQETRSCHFCGLPVTKRVAACIACNHMLHSECAMEWWVEEDMNECPSGCGCKCLKYTHADLNLAH
ncbi:unnamed protein product [Ambrosiozyma monospora]|uniref:Unnamed protein product n=1 Tax=Ambrosiozyma monospora TaxID=43982 RepID=A0A9W7DJT7_AMBMO|nr:unnamed protein product [Ambrosiozyma monospora]